MNPESLSLGVAPPRTKTEPLQRAYFLARPPEWTKQAKCLGAWRDYETPEHTRVSSGRAALLCEGCPVKEQCLNDALEAEGTLRYGFREGVRGGLNPVGRSRLAALRRLQDEGRCPCHEHPFNPDEIRWSTDRPLCRIKVRAQPSAVNRKTRIRACPVCGADRTNLSRHISRRHSNQEVA